MTDCLVSGRYTAAHAGKCDRALDHRETCILGVVLDRDKLYADLICDGVHVALSITCIRMGLALADARKVVLDGVGRGE
jgi:N-acetylglucosamine-6-phosphate deacetylase